MPCVCVFERISLYFPQANCYLKQGKYKAAEAMFKKVSISKDDNFFLFEYFVKGAQDSS